MKTDEQQIDWQQRNLLAMKTNTDALKRVQEGDHSPQTIAELAAHYLRIVQTSWERYDQLKRQSVDEIWERFRELGLHHGHRVQWWAGKAVKASMIGPILEIEYPEQAYKDALKSVGVDPETVWHYCHRHISSKA